MMKVMIKLIESFKPISNDLLMMLLYNKDENHETNENVKNNENNENELLLNKLETIVSDLLNPLKFDEIKWIWFEHYLLNSSIWFVKNKKNESFYSLIEKKVSQYENEILSVKMKQDIIESKIMDEKEEWSIIINQNNNYEINKKIFE